MSTVEALRRFKFLIEKRLNRKTIWGGNDAIVEVNNAYQEILEILISPNTENPSPPEQK